MYGTIEDNIDLRNKF